MAKLKVAEVFFSIQGEGLYHGVPSVFLRMFGCNRRCPLYGLPKTTKIDKYNPEVKKVIDNLDQYEKYEDLPLVHSGCDTYAAVYPEFKHLSNTYEVSDIANKIIKLLPDCNFSADKHLILTGGESLLPAWQKNYPDLIDILVRKANLSHVTFETNGTLELTAELADFLTRTANSYKVEYTFSVSSKLPCSGHSFEESVNINALKDYYWYGQNVYFKWVVGNRDDVEDVKKMIQLYQDGFSNYGLDVGDEPDMSDFPIYLMPVGGTVESYLTEKEVAEICLENGWRFSPRTQVRLYKNSWGA